MSDKQIELDVKKWLDSEKAGIDTCGSYEYCANCDKSLENPCARAYEKATTVEVPKAKRTCAKKATTTATPAKKTCAKKTASLECAVKVEAKKPAAKKTTAKKTTAKKTTTKKAAK